MSPDGRQGIHFELPGGAARHVLPFLIMLAGCATVMALVFFINGLIKVEDQRKSERGVLFDAQPEVKAPEDKTAKPIAQAKRRPAKKATAPAPDLAIASIAGQSFGLSWLENVDAQGADASFVESLTQGAGSLVMTEDAVDEPPKIRLRTAATYPARARQNGITGQVTLNLLVGEDGSVEQVRVLDADPAGVFDEAAMAAVRNWQFNPATYGGKPVRAWVRQTIRFELT